MNNFEHVIITYLEENYLSYQEQLFPQKKIFLPKNIQAPNHWKRITFPISRKNSFILWKNGCTILNDEKTIDTHFFTNQVVQYYQNYNIKTQDIEELSFIFNNYIEQSLQINTLSHLNFEKKEDAISFFNQKLTYLSLDALKALHSLIKNDSTKQQILIFKKFLNTKSNQIKLHLPRISSFFKENYSLEELNPILSVHEFLKSFILDKPANIISINTKYSILFFDISLNQETLYPIQLPKGIDYLKSFTNSIADSYQIFVDYQYLNKKNKLSIHFFSYQEKSVDLDADKILQLFNDFFHELKQQESLFYDSSNKKILDKNIDTWLKKEILSNQLNSDKISKKSLKI